MPGQIQPLVRPLAPHEGAALVDRQAVCVWRREPGRHGVGVRQAILPQGPAEKPSQHHQGRVQVSAAQLRRHDGAGRARPGPFAKILSLLIYDRPERAIALRHRRRPAPDRRPPAQPLPGPARQHRPGQRVVEPALRRVPRPARDMRPAVAPDRGPRARAHRRRVQGCAAHPAAALVRPDHQRGRDKAHVPARHRDPHRLLQQRAPQPRAAAGLFQRVHRPARPPRLHRVARVLRGELCAVSGRAAGERRIPEHPGRRRQQPAAPGAGVRRARLHRPACRVQGGRTAGEQRGLETGGPGVRFRGPVAVQGDADAPARAGVVAFAREPAERRAGAAQREGLAAVDQAPQVLALVARLVRQRHRRPVRGRQQLCVDVVVAPAHQRPVARERRGSGPVKLEQPGQRARAPARARAQGAADAAQKALHPGSRVGDVVAQHAVARLETVLDEHAQFPVELADVGVVADEAAEPAVLAAARAELARRARERARPRAGVETEQLPAAEREPCQARTEAGQHDAVAGEPGAGGGQ
ncbi:hypothetical protein KL923_000186 [Ogataea haglerorum]|nr:hypothetical protein KL923_000186 [Ogataea haglerorum]